LGCGNCRRGSLASFSAGCKSGCFPTLEDVVLIDCDACVMRGPGCRDCVVTVLLGMPPEQSSIQVDDDELAALGVLAQSGLVPPLRLVHAVSSVEPNAAAEGDPAADAV
jgi:hypothetical protein